MISDEVVSLVATEANVKSKGGCLETTSAVVCSITVSSVVGLNCLTSEICGRCLALKRKPSGGAASCLFNSSTEAEVAGGSSIAMSNASSGHGTCTAYNVVRKNVSGLNDG